MDTNQHTQAFTAWLRSWGASDTTISTRTIVIRAGSRQWGPDELVTTETLAEWLGQPRFSAWTRVTYHSHLRSYFGWLTATGRIPANPTRELRSPQPPKDKPRPLSATEARRVLEGSTGRQHTWLVLGMFAGLRAHEIAKLRGEDVDEQALYVLGKGRQGAILPTHDLVWEEALGYPRQGWWFPSHGATGHVTAQSISTMTTRLFGSLGVEGSIHRCRHSYATQLLRGGANIRVVQTLMRHSALASTARYTAVDEEERVAAIRGLAA